MALIGIVAGAEFDIEMKAKEFKKCKNKYQERWGTVWCKEITVKEAKEIVKKLLKVLKPYRDFVGEKRFFVFEVAGKKLIVEADFYYEKINLVIEEI
jgi:hypothetical protein